MGCDIHMYIEIKESGQWKYYDWRKKYQVGTYEDGSPNYDYDKYWDDPLRVGRNYDLFAILANVRNGYGFAGVPTGTGFKPISEPRGLPLDVTPEVAVESERWGKDGHSHSWMILKELLDYDWEGQATTQYGVVHKDQYQEFKQNGKPQSWSGDTWGARIKKVSNAEMEQVLNGELDDSYDYVTAVQWQETYKDAVGERWFKTLDLLSTFDSPDKNIRLVFWFDN